MTEPHNAESGARLERAGLWAYRGRYAIRTTWDGPRGGQPARWEIADDDPYGGLVIEGMHTYRTLADALAAIDQASPTTPVVPSAD